MNRKRTGQSGRPILLSIDIPWRTHRRLWLLWRKGKHVSWPIRYPVGQSFSEQINKHTVREQQAQKANCIRV